MRTFALILLIPATLAAAQDAFPQRETIEKFVQGYVDAEICNAISIGVVHGDQTWTGHFGQLSKEKKQPPDDQTIYEIGSISKVFTGVLLADAVQSGTVKLDQPIGTLMKKLQSSNKEVGESITLEHLSTHNSGLPRMPNNFSPADPQNPYADYDRDRLTQFMSTVKPDSKPGAETAYSNLAAGLLGDLLAARAGISYDRLLKQTIAEPLKMSNTTIALSPAQSARLAPPHNAGLSSDSAWDFDALAGAGGIRSTVPDMMRFMQAALHPPDSPLGKAIELSWKEHVRARGKSFAMGLGWHIARDGSTRWHNGQTGGYHSMMLVSRNLDAVVVVLSNTATGEVDAIAESILTHLAGKPLRPRNFAEVKKIDEVTMKRLVGRYQIVPQFVLDVKLEKDRLMVQATNQPSLRVYPESAKRWKYRVVDAEITFELPETGPATALTLHQNGRDMRGPRMKDE